MLFFLSPGWRGSGGRRWSGARETAVEMGAPVQSCQPPKETGPPPLLSSYLSFASGPVGGGVLLARLYSSSFQPALPSWRAPFFTTAQQASQRALVTTHVSYSYRGSIPTAKRRLGYLGCQKNLLSCYYRGCIFHFVVITDPVSETHSLTYSTLNTIHGFLHNAV